MLPTNNRESWVFLFFRGELSILVSQRKSWEQKSKKNNGFGCGKGYGLKHEIFSLFWKLLSQLVLRPNSFLEWLKF